MPLTTYTAGEVLTASSLNANFSFAASNGLTLVTSQTIGSAVTSVAVTSVFSSTYDNYLITISGGVGAAAANLGLQLGATTTNYFNVGTVLTYAGVSTVTANNGGTSFQSAGVATTDSINAYIHLFGPNLAKNTQFTSTYIFGNPATGSGDWSPVGGYQRSTTQFTDFTIISAQALTGGTICVYGYQNS